MKIELQPSFVLHVRPYRDSSALVEAFTAAHGRIGVVARGARSEKSRLRGMLQPFRRVLLSWSGRGELYTLIGAEEVGPVVRLAGEALISGFYVNELMMRLSHRGDANEQLFACYAATLQALSETGDPQSTLRVFEKRLLESLGYGLELRHDTEGEALAADRSYGYVIELGPVPLSSAGMEHIPVTGATLLALAEERFDNASSLRESKTLMRAILRYYLGSKPLHSRDLFRRRAGDGDSPQS